MNYIGSKHTLLDFLDRAISEITDLSSGVFCDLFAGTGVVGLRFKQKGFKIISNDIQYYSFALSKHIIENHEVLKFESLQTVIPQLKNLRDQEKPSLVCEYLNNLSTVEGFIYKNYALGGTRGQEFERQYFTDENAKKCDTIRLKIEEWKNSKNIINSEYWFLLASLLECVDKVANTAAVYGAFLKKIKRSAQNVFMMRPIPLYVNELSHNVYNKNANDLVKEIEADIIYIDPPYNHRQYCSNYHILETIALNDNPKITGKTGLRKDISKVSKYCSKQKVKEEFKSLIQNIRAKYIFVSYNNEGLLSKKDLQEILSTCGEYGIVERDYKRFKADNETKRNIGGNKTVEYLHYVKCFLK